MGGFDLSVPLQADSPFKIDAAAGFVNQDNEKKLYLHGNYLGGNYKYEIGFKRKGNEIEPILKFNADMTYLEGKIIEQKTSNGVKYSLKQVKFGRDSFVTTVDGSIEVSGPKLSANLKFQQGHNVVNVVGSLGYQQGQLDSELKLSSSQYAMANGILVYGLKFSDKNLGNELSLIWDKDHKTKINKLEWSQFADWGDKDLFKMKNSLAIGKFNAAGRFNGEFSKKVLNVDAGFDYNDQKSEFKIDNKYSQKAPHDYETSIFAMANQKSIKLDMKRDIEGESSRILNKLELSTGLRVELNGKIGHKIELTSADVSLQAVFVPGPKKDQTKVTTLLKNTDKDHAANSKVTVGKNEFASWDSKLSYGQQMTGTIKGSITDVITLDGTITSMNGKGDSVINASIKDRKLKANSKFTIQKPTFDFETDIFYDYEKDNTKKVHFLTSNNIVSNSFDSKNQVELFNEHFGFNVAATNQGTFLEGTQKGSAEVQLPTGRKMALIAEREVKMSNSKGNGQFRLTATDELPNKQQRQAIFDAKINDFNPKAGYFDMNGSIKYRDHDNKDAKIQMSLKNLKKGDFATAAGSLQIDGTLLPEITTISVNLEEYCENHAIYNMNGKYGKIGEIDVNGKFYVATKERPQSHDFTGKLDVPNTKLSKLTVTSNGQLTEPTESDDSYIVKYLFF